MNGGKMKEQLINIANENLEIFKRKEYIVDKTRILLTKSLEKMISNTKIYSNYYRNGINITRLCDVPKTDPEIIITKQDSFSAAIDQLKNFKTSCVLNFASAKYPGGGFLKGSAVQEEDLCRKSTLYESISRQNELYEWSTKHLRGSLYSDWCIFSPNVVIIRDSNLKLMRPVACTVLTSPAPNRTAALKNKTATEEDIVIAMKNRCELILKVAAVEKRTNLVLGAFGCGVFGNDPKIVAEIWRDLLKKEKYGKYFKHITFAIKTNKDESNYNAFVKTFKK